MVKQSFQIEELEKQGLNSAQEILRTLGSLEHGIVSSLYKSDSAMSAKTIQKQIVLALILRRINKTGGLEIAALVSLLSEAIATFNEESVKAWTNLILGNIKSGKTAFQNVPEIKIVELYEKIPVERLLNIARTSKIEVPSHITISNHLQSLCDAGFVGKRTLGESRRAEALYFITPKFFQILKNSNFEPK